MPSWIWGLWLVDIFISFRLYASFCVLLVRLPGVVYLYICVV